MFQITFTVNIHPLAGPYDEQATFLWKKVVQMVIDNDSDTVRRLLDDLGILKAVLESFKPLPAELLPVPAPFIPEGGHIFVIFAHHSGRY